MSRYLVARAGQAVFVVFAVSVISFVLLRQTGDPATVLLPFDATQEQRALLRQAYGLDRPVPVQYVDFLLHVVQGDFGISIRFHQSAMGLVLQRFPATLELAFLGVALTVLCGVPAGVLAAVKRHTLVDRLIVNAALLGQAVPSFWLGIVMILVFAVVLHWLPTSGGGGLDHLIMPVASLSAFFIPQIVVLVRSGMLDTLSEPYVRTARAKGLHERVVLYRHALRNALIPVITVVGLNFGTLLGGAVVTETVFAWPGVGLLALQAIYASDFPVVQAAVFVMAVGIVATNMLVDVLYGWADPRIRFTA